MNPITTGVWTAEPYTGIDFALLTKIPKCVCSGFFYKAIIYEDFQMDFVWDYTAN